MQEEIEAGRELARAVRRFFNVERLHETPWHADTAAALDGARREMLGTYARYEPFLALLDKNKKEKEGT